MLLFMSVFVRVFSYRLSFTLDVCMWLVGLLRVNLMWCSSRRMMSVKILGPNRTRHSHNLYVSHTLTMDPSAIYRDM